MALPVAGNKFSRFIETWTNDDKNFQTLVKGSTSPTVNMYKNFASAFNKNKSPHVNSDKKMHQWDSSLSKKEHKNIKSEAVTLRRHVGINNFVKDIYYGREFFLELFKPDDITSGSASGSKKSEMKNNDTSEMKHGN